MRAALLSLIVLAGGCGYRFSSGGALPDNVKTVCTPVFTNGTAEPGLEVVFTEAMRRRVIRAGTAGASCDAKIEGEVRSVYGAPTVLAPNNMLASYRIFATARLRLTRDGRVLSETAVTGSEDYVPGADILGSEANRQAALERLATELMRDGYARLASGW